MSLKEFCCAPHPLCLLQLKEVVLKSGKVLRADVCVVGVGKACVGAEPGREGALLARGEAEGDVAAAGPWWGSASPAGLPHVSLHI